MTRVLWLTDPHLNFCDDAVKLCDAVGKQAPEALLLGGDFTEAPTLEQTLLEIETLLRVPIYFVLGNHDYYRGSIRGVREVAAQLGRERQRLIWLPLAGVVPLSETTALVGHGGWGDGRYGDYAHSTVRLHDHDLIDDFRGLDSSGRLRLMQTLGDGAAEHLRQVLPAALEQHRRVIVLTHVPPFAEAAWHEGRMSDPYFLPHFSCKALGEVIRREAEAHPEQELLVLCGHTHGYGTARILANLKVVTARAVYGKPAMQAVFDVDEPFDCVPFPGPL